MDERNMMLDRLSAAEFAYWETRLYLDVHPCDTKAIAAMKKYHEQAKRLREEFECRYGSLTGAPDCAERWTWVDDPWPWNC